MVDSRCQPGRASGDDPGSVVAFPEGRGPQSPPTNLPLRLTSFVGRDRELEEAERLLEESRLLTLTGAAGCGKTRLAMEIGDRSLGRYPDGVWLVGLAPLSEPELVLQEVASVVGVRERPGLPLTGAISDHLRSKKLLLVLDNCEHLIESCAALAETLLRTCPQLQILVTGRESLRVGGETVLPVTPLPTPGSRHPSSSVEELSHTGAARLFVERASAVRPGFALTEENAVEVSRICEGLSGIPLAIELAAARVRVLSVAQIAERLGDALGVLTSGDRTAPPRHRTLVWAMDWSHGLLEGKERVLFRRLSVFAGDFTLKAVEEVCSGEPLQRGEILDLLGKLVERSLVVSREEHHHGRGRMRYRLLEVIRQYAREKLESSGEADRLREGHAEHYLSVSEAVEAELANAERSGALEQLEGEHDNLRAALGWARESGEAKKGLRLAGALFLFWFHQGYWSEGRNWLEGALGLEEAPENSQTRAARAKVLLGSGRMDWFQGDHAAARPRLEQSVALFRELGDRGRLSDALHFLSLEMVGWGERAAARSLAEESVALARQEGDNYRLATALAGLGIVAQNQGDYEGSWSPFEESAAICRKIGEHTYLSISLRGLGNLALRWQGDYDRAVTLLKESLIPLRGHQQQKWFVSNSLGALAVAVAMQGDPGRAARLFGACDALYEELGTGVPALHRANHERGVAAAREALGEQAFEAARQEGRGMTFEEAIAYALGEPTPEEVSTTLALPPSTDPAGLTAREVEVLRLVAEGLTNSQVAQRLYISRRTVGHHLHSIYDKLDVPSRAAAAREAVERSLI